MSGHGIALSAYLLASLLATIAWCRFFAWADANQPPLPAEPEVE